MISGIRLSGIISALTVLSLLSTIPAFGQQSGDALQLLSYEIRESTEPDVSDGQIAPDTQPADWQAAYVRQMTIGINGDDTNDPRKMTMLIGNDSDTLYIAAAVELANASDLNHLTLYFDQQTDGTLDGSSSDPGEYFVNLQVDQPAGDGHWDGNQWVANVDTAAVGTAIRKGSGGTRLYNFELKIPLNKSGDSDNNYLSLSPGDEVGILPEITDNDNDKYYWVKTNATPTDPSATGPNGNSSWADLKTIGEGEADRNLVALSDNGITPTIDGNISGDDNWRYSFEKDIILTDLSGNTYDANLKLKEVTASGNLVFGITVFGLNPANTDALSVYFDQGSSGGPLNYILNQSGATYFDDASRVLGDGTYQDYNFDSSNWVQDGSSHGSGNASVNSNGNWEIEMTVPNSSGDNEDLNITSGDATGMLLEFQDASTGKSFWWSATINTKKIQIDPVDPVYNALGWGNLQTGGPFVQSLYPEEGDTLSGEYPLAVYTTDPNDAVPETGIEDVAYEVRREDPNTGTVTTLLEGTMNKVEDDSIPIWTATLNTRAIDVSPSTQLRLVYQIYDGEIDTVNVPVNIFINNQTSGTNVDDPAVSVNAPSPNDTLSGAGVNIDFSAQTSSRLTLDTLQVYVDGALKQTYTPSNTSSFSDVFNWNTSPLADGEHIIQVRAVNSLNISNFSPTIQVVTENSPEISLDSPSASSILRDTIQVDFTATPVAPATLSNTEISIDGGSWQSVDTQPASSGGSGSHQWITTNVADGTHSIRVRTTDSNGKTTLSDEIQVTVDNTAPTGSLVADSDRYKNGDEVTFRYNAGETGLNALIPTAELQNLDDQASSPLTLTDNNRDGTYVATYTISGTNTLSDGSKTLTAQVADSAGNTYQPNLNVFLDNTRPVFNSITVLNEDSVFQNGEKVRLQARFDTSGYRIDVNFDTLDATFTDGEATIKDHGNGSYTINYTLGGSNDKADGTYPLSVSASDQVGLADTGSVNLILDNNGPEADTLYMADEDRIINSTDSLFVRLTDVNLPIDSLEYFVDVIGDKGTGQPITPVDGALDSTTEEASTPINITDLQDGRHTIYVRGRDISGSWGPVAEISFRLDTTPPTGKLISSKQRVTNGDSLQFSIETGEKNLSSHIPVRELQQLDSTATSNLQLQYSGHGIYKAYYQISPNNTAADGNKTIRAQVTDRAGNGHVDSTTVYLDNSAPELKNISIENEDARYQNGDKVTLSLTYDQPGYQLNAAFDSLDQQYVNDEEHVTDKMNGQYLITYTISEKNRQIDGPHPVFINASDQVGLTTQDTVELVLDNKGPSIASLNIADADTNLNASDTLFAALRDFDSPITGAEYFIDAVGVRGSGTPLEASDGTFDSTTEKVQSLIPIDTLQQGSHTLYVRGKDASGSWGLTSKIPFTVDTKAPLIQDVEIVYPGNQTAAHSGQQVLIKALVTDKTTRVNPDSVRLTATSVNQAIQNYKMNDNGNGGDRVGGDDVHTAEIQIKSNKTASDLAFNIRATDILPNSRSKQGSLQLDNTKPSLQVNVQPIPEGKDSLNGTVYKKKVLISGSYYDQPDSSNVKSIRIHVENKQGKNVNDSPVKIPATEQRTFSRKLTLVEGQNFVRVTTTDINANTFTKSFNLEYVNPNETRMVTTNGGTVESGDGTSVDIPEGAIPENTEITITRTQTDQLPEPANEDYKLMAEATELGPEGLVFDQPVTVTLTYNESELDINQDGDPEFTESDLVAFYWSGENWIKMTPDQKSAEQNTVTFNTNHFSIYALGVDASSEDFDFYWTRNPFRPRNGTSAVIETADKKATISLKIYDTSGHLIRTIADNESISGTTTRGWNGQNDFQEFVGDGVYIYVFKYTGPDGEKRVIRKPIGVVQ